MCLLQHSKFLAYFIERFRFCFLFFLLSESEKDLRYNMVEDPILKSFLTQVDFPGLAAAQWNHITKLCLRKQT